MTPLDETIDLYVAAVDAALRDLSPAARAALLEGLPEHLAEVRHGDDRSVHEILGPPEQYAEELRRAAGLSSARTEAVPAATAGAAPSLPPPRPPGRPTLLDRAQRWWPIWALGAAWGVGVWTSDAGALATFPVVRVDDRALLGAAVIVGALLLARRLDRRPRHGVATGALIAAGILGLVAVSVEIRDAAQRADDAIPWASATTLVPYQATLPDLVGLPLPEAEIALSSIGVAWELVTVGNAGTDPVVVRTEPPAYAPVAPGTFVIVTVRALDDASHSAPPTTAP